MDQTFAQKVLKSSQNEEFFYLVGKMQSTPKEIDFTIFDPKDYKNAWQTKLTEDVSNKVCDMYGLDTEDYWKAILGILELGKDAAGNFAYVLKDDKFRIEKLVSSQIKLVYAELAVKTACPVESLASFCEIQHKMLLEAKSDNKRLTKELEECKKDREVLREQLETLTCDTVAKEEALLSNFLVLLNSKKSEIARLREHGTAAGSTAADESGDSVYDADTDEEGGTKDSPPQSSTSKNVPGAKKAKKTDSDNFDDIMDL